MSKKQLAKGSSSGRKTALANLRSLLEQAKEQIALALPRHMTPERMMRIVLTTVQRTPQLLECSPRSILGCVVEASQLGLEPDGILGHAYLVPFWNKHTQQRECQLIPGYKGLIDLARRSGQLSTIYAQVVYEKDRFEFAYGLDPKLVHVPSGDPDPGAVVAAYAVARLKDGSVQFDVMWRHQIDRIRQRSRAGDSGPWVTDYEEMAKKTVLRRLCKMLPCSVELQRAVALDELASAGMSQQMGRSLEVEVPEEEPKSSLDRLTDQITGPHHPAGPGATRSFRSGLESTSGAEAPSRSGSQPAAAREVAAGPNGTVPPVGEAATEAGQEQLPLEN